MKITLIIAAVLIAAGTFYGCSKGSNANTSTTDSSFMKANIAGYAFAVSGPSAANSGASSSGGLNFIYINGLAANGKAIQIILTNVTAAGTYPFGSGNAQAYYYSSGGFQGAGSYAASGSVSVTSFSPDIIGTFNFTTTDNVVITGGSFRVTAQ